MSTNPAKMSASGMKAIWVCLLSSVLSVVVWVEAEKYIPLKVEIKPNKNGEPVRVFTSEEISRYDGSNVSR